MNDAHRKPLLSALAAALCLSAASAQTITLIATEFPRLTGGPADFYVDARNKALAIDASTVEFRGKWAIAETAFPGQAGTYDIAISSMYESDGESRYALWIGKDSVGGFQNPSAYTGDNLTTPDYTSYKHTFRGVAVAKGAAIKVYGMAHSNGKVPEKGGFAWSRGRWSRIDFTPAVPSALAGMRGLPSLRAAFTRDAVTLTGLGLGSHALLLRDPSGRTLFRQVIEAGVSGQVTVPWREMGGTAIAFVLTVQGTGKGGPSASQPVRHLVLTPGAP